MNEFWAAIAGALVGSIVGGIISYCLQRQSFSQNQAERREQRMLEEKALAHSLTFKVLQIFNNLANIRKHVLERKALGGELPPVSYLTPIINLPDPVTIEASEMVFLLSLGSDDVLNEIIDLPQFHNGIIPVWNQYAAAREVLNSMATISIDLETGMGEFEFEKGSVTAVKFFEANQMASDIIERAHRDYGDASKASQNLLKLLQSKMGLSIKIDAKNLQDK